VLEHVPDASRNGGKEPRLPNTSNIAFEGLEGENLLLALDQAGICVSTGSACTSGNLEPSHVLTAMGIPPDKARGALRFSFGSYNTQEELDYLMKTLPVVVEKLRAAGPGNLNMTAELAEAKT